MPKKTAVQLEREIADALARPSKLPTDVEIIELIAAIDHFHGNELKDRTRAHIAQEAAVIKRFLQDFSKK